MQAQNAIAEMHNSTTMEVCCYILFSDSLEFHGKSEELAQTMFETYQLA